MALFDRYSWFAGTFGFGFTQTDRINVSIVESGSVGKAQELFITSSITEFVNSKQFSWLFVEDAYWNNRADIDEKKREVVKTACNDYIGFRTEEINMVSNVKLQHNIYNKLVRQKLAYLNGKPPTYKAVYEQDVERFETFLTWARPKLTRKLHNKIKLAETDAIRKKFGYIMTYYDDNMELQFQYLPSEEVIPFWADDEMSELEAAIWFRVVESFTGNTRKFETHVDFFTKEGTFRYIKNDTELVLRTDVPGWVPAYYYDFSIFNTAIDRPNLGESEVIPVVWEKLPIIPFKYTNDGKDLLHNIKTIIDDYNMKTSVVSDLIADIPNSIMLIKNYDGGDIDAFNRNLAQYRKAFVTEDGDAKVLSTPLNVADYYTHIKALKQDIYEFGMGVNTTDKDMRDTSGTALRFLYSDLDMDTTNWASEVTTSYELLVWFLMQDAKLKGIGDFTDIEYEIIFSRDVIVNETEVINNCINSKEILSLATIQSQHPWVTDPEAEYIKLMEQQREVQELETAGVIAPTSGGFQTVATET